MRRYSKFILVAGAVTALAAPSAAMAAGNSDNAHACQQNGWQTLVRQDGTSFANQGDCVSYGAHGGVTKNKVTAPVPVTLPQFEAVCGANASATVPYTPHVQTYLMGVNGYPETSAITGPVTVTPDMVGGQFWIKYVVDDGYTAANAGQWHIDFNASCPAV
jgi:hypothetical protein